jgi:putative heme transporter
LTSDDRTTPAPTSARRRRAVLVRRLVVAVLVVVLGYFGVSLLVSNFDEVTGAADLIGRPHLGWLALAIAAEVASYVTYAMAQRRLLARERPDIGLPRLTLLSVAAQALGVCLPGGYAWANVFSYRIMRRWRLDEFAAGRVLFATAALYVAALALLALIGAEVAGGSGPAGDVRVIAYSVLGALALVVGFLLLRPQLARRWLLAFAAAADRRLGGRRAAAARVARLRRELDRAASLGRDAIAGATVWLLAAWLGDVCCLIAAFGAVGSTPPWRGVLLAYCAGQLAALLPFTPGGLGVVEGSLTFALVSYGGGQERTVAAVLLYRLISFWGLIPAGAACYGALRTRLGGAPVGVAEVAG